jgi:hypothetical protein
VEAEPDFEAVVDELYAAPPSSFTQMRTDAVKEARGRGERELAKAIGALRRPTRSAWVLNQLVRSSAASLDELASLGSSLRSAEKDMKASDLRRLSAQRNELVEAMGRSALEAAGLSEADADADMRREVQETLTASLADPSVLDVLRTGALVKPAVWSGFGVASPEDLAAVPVGSGRRPAPARAGRTPAGRAPAERDEPAAAQPRESDSASSAAERARERRAAAKRAEAEAVVAEAEVALSEARAHAVEADDRVEQARRDLDAARSAAAEAKDGVTTARRRLRMAEAALDALR